MALKVFILAGEASGDRLGAALIQGLQSLVGDVELRGVAGPLMQELGMPTLFPMEELSVMGIAEVLPKYPELRRRLKQTAEDCVSWCPDVLVTIDSPDFSLRLASLVKAASSTPTVHYVAPSVWAWRPGRAQKMARHIDHVLALLPFEPKFMTDAGMSCDFVGHPIVSEPTAAPEDVADFRKLHKLGDAPIALVLPGSRLAEVQRLAPVFGEALRAIMPRTPDLRVVVPTTPHVASTVLEAITNWPGAPVVLDPRSDPNNQTHKRSAFKAADVALAASGTVSLELAAAQTPMVIAYDMNWLSWQLMSRLANIDTVTLVNLVSEKNVVPEFLGPKCQPALIANAMSELLADEQARDAQLKAMQQVMIRLGQGEEAPGTRAARSVLNFLSRRAKAH
mgnify:CR=1 FL=1